MIQLMNQDCLEALKTIQDGSVDLVLTDPPYNIHLADWDTWKTKEEYVAFCEKWIKELERVLKKNGSFYFFHNDMSQIAMLIEMIRQKTKFKLVSFITMNKPNFRNLSWKNPSDKNNLRSWFNTCEYCLYYTFEDSGSSGKRIAHSKTNFSELKAFAAKINELYALKSSKSLISITQNQGLFHFLGSSSISQFGLPTLPNYEKLVEFLKQSPESFDVLLQDYREYLSVGGFQSLKKAYEDQRATYEDQRATHNLDPNHNNVFEWKEVNRGNEHPCKKPVEILKRLIRTSSNDGDLVLDVFMGSGTTGVAAKQLNRKFIGIERDKKFFEIAKKNIDNA